MLSILCKDIKVIDSVRQAAVRPTCSSAQSATSPKAVDQAFALIAKQVRVALARHVPARTRQRARPPSERMRARSADHPER
ncbi:hypothetical protein [Xanthomonas citri]|uniref:hypothetical protein n=1 Tax=Xanthomonas citri TaxID=346 RepID=UPI001E2F4758|nr:hypothetical protein [Xanthomonas citri]